ncbi:MAG TPA: alkaline phosphatase PhoX [Chthoniobacterales bacterium]|nr:alkaline phosphatase PhoX [Chthoniobacterales bacterium]
MKLLQIKKLNAPLAALLLAASPAFAQEGFVTNVKPYVEPTAGSPYSIRPILSVGDQVPETSHPALRYQMVGIPDGLGARRDRDKITLFMNHELGNTIESQPIIGGPIQRGAFVSKYTLAEDGSVLSGERAYDRVFYGNKLVGHAAEVGNATPGFARLCSGTLVGPEEGFDRPIYFAGEESGGTATFDGRGGLAVAFFDNEAHTLPKLGHLAWENVVPRPFNGNETVIMCMEDGPSTPDSQLYMYVGKKERRKGVSVLRRNGLNNGQLYAFRSKDRSRNSETTFQNGSIVGEWVAIPNAAHLDDVQLEAAADARNAFGFIRTEDGTWGKTSRKDYYFVTTGGDPGLGNTLGRAYHLELNPGNPLKDAKLTIIYNADQIIAAGGDIAISPDNIDTSGDYLMICEDGTTASREVMAAKGRDGSVWRLDLNDNFAARRVAELNPPGRDGVPVGPGVWESSGIIDAATLFGDDSWILDVQAHLPTTPPSPATQVEDGQLVIMTPSGQ